MKKVTKVIQTVWFHTQCKIYMDGGLRYSSRTKYPITSAFTAASCSLGLHISGCLLEFALHFSPRF